MSGPLAGIRVIELGGIGPGPFCGMLLSDLGADVIQVHRETSDRPSGDPIERGRRSVVLDLKQPLAVDAVLRLIDRADVVFEGFRPGVAERLGVGPDACMRRNTRLVYGRMTGWGRDGPYSGHAGHDINYLALAGALHLIGRAGQAPTPPLNLVGDFGAGGVFLAFGIVSALLERERSGRGQVVDAAIVDGVALLSASIHSLWSEGRWCAERGRNVLDGGSARYDAYETKDGRWVCVGVIEDRFLARLLAELGADDDADLLAELRTGFFDLSTSPAAKEKLATIFRSRTRDEWCTALDDVPDVCFAPVLDPAEAMHHPHNRARATFVDVDGVPQAAPAPRFGRTQPAMPRPAPVRGQHSHEVLSEAGLSRDQLVALGIVANGGPR